MTWKRATVLPEHDNTVLVANQWGDLFFASCETFEDHSRAWIPGEMSSDRLDRYLWTECYEPTDEDWEQ